MTRLCHPSGYGDSRFCKADVLHFMAYIFAWTHQTITESAHGQPSTPAMATGVETTPRTMQEVVCILKEWEPVVS
ncbi:MAG: hypothetical protein OXQ29_23055 [Rhodospirillaceae bacterium]|nr:hypothetical protein [Rhodospirillaceae bacterium]